VVFRRGSVCTSLYGLKGIFHLKDMSIGTED